ncbi:MAG TPA: hypothetical protein VGE95_03065 [Arthrobacter sp.]
MAIASDGGLPEVLSPGREPLRSAYIVEQLCWRQCIYICFRKPPGELGPFRLGSKADALPLPLDIFGRTA